MKISLGASLDLMIVLLMTTLYLAQPAGGDPKKLCGHGYSDHHQQFN